MKCTIIFKARVSEGSSDRDTVLGQNKNSCLQDCELLLLGKSLGKTITFPQNLGMKTNFLYNESFHVMSWLTEAEFLSVLVFWLQVGTSYLLHCSIIFMRRQARNLDIYECMCECMYTILSTCAISIMSRCSSSPIIHSFTMS